MRIKLLCWLLGHRWQWVLVRYAGFNYRFVTSQCQRCGVFKRERLRADTVFHAGYDLTYTWERSPYDRVPLISDTSY